MKDYTMNSKIILSDQNNFKSNEMMKMNKIINIESLNNDLKESGKSFADYFIRDVPDQIVSLLSIIKDVIHDPRRKTGNFKHEITPIFGIIFLSIIAGYDFVKSIYNFGKDLWDTITSILGIEDQYPSYDTFRRVLNSTKKEDIVEVRKRWHESIGISYKEENERNNDKDNSEFEEYSQSWIDKANKDLDDLIEGRYTPPVQVCAQDGKLMRATRSRVNKESAFDVISIYNVESGVVLAESTVPNKKNEISENLNVIEQLNPEGKYLLSYDALGCQKELASSIENHNWLYLLKVKDNQPILKRTIEETFNKYGGEMVFTRESTEGGHYTLWRYYVCDRVEESKKEWAGVKSYGMVYTYSERDGEVTEEISYYIMNFLDPALFVYAKIMHWRIENRLHHSLDCVFHEDKCRVRTGYGHENLNIIRKCCLTFYRYALRKISDKHFSLKSLTETLRKSIFSINKCIENVKLNKIFYADELMDEVINI